MTTDGSTHRGGRPWRIAALALAAALATAALVSVGGDASEDADVSVSTGPAGEACDELEVRGFRVRGGCPLEIGRGEMDFTVLSVFGDQQLGKCPLRFTARIGPSGELGLGEITTVDNGLLVCGDMVACRPGRGAGLRPDQPLPWRGRVLAAERGFAVILDACLDTCLGRFEGPLRLDLQPSPGGGWHMRTARAALGTSGLEVGGDWTLQTASGKPLRVENG